MPEPSREELARVEAELYARVRAARERYNAAKDEAEILYGIQSELSLNHPDGRAASLRAARTESAAIDNYAKALHAFAAFVLKKYGSIALIAMDGRNGRFEKLATSIQRSVVPGQVYDRKMCFVLRQDAPLRSRL